MSAFYFTVARYYDAENSDKVDDLALYSRLAAGCDGAVLDVGCGTGRVLIHLADGGHRVCGIDNDGPMLARLEAKLETLPHLRDKICWVEADVLRHEFDRKFSLILLSYNALMHFRAQAEQIKLLSNLRGCLADGGAVVIDLPNAAPAFASEDRDALTLERRFLDHSSGNLVMLQSASWIDRARQLLHVEWIYDEIDGDGVVKRLIAPHQLRYFFLPELRLLLERCGFKIGAVYGDAEEAPYDAESERMIVIARGA